MNQKSIAVLPFHNISADIENEYFADGMTEELIIALGRVDGLKVTARTSSFTYKEKKKDVRVIGNELGVSTVLEGSIRKSGKRIRITAQLIRTDNGFHIWSESFNRELTDIFQLQDEISLLIAEKIRENFGHLEIEDHLIRAKTSNIEAYQQYLKARFYQLNWNYDDFSRAIDFYKLSIKLDPRFYQSYFGIVQCCGIMAAWNFSDKQAALKEADYYLKKGLAIQAESPEGYFTLATNSFWVNWNANDGLSYLKKALSLAPNDTESLEASAECHTALGQFEEALECINTALESNPLSANHCYTKGNVYYLQRNFNEALKWMNNALDIDPKWDLALQIKACCYILKKDRTALEALIESTPEITNRQALLSLYEVRNENRQIERDDFGDMPTGYLPWDVYAPLYTGQTTTAIQALRQGIKNRFGQYVNFLHDPLLEPLREHPAYQQLGQQTFFSEKTAELPVAPKLQATAKLSEREIEHFKKAVRTTMESENLYRNPDLTLRSLAEQIALHPNKLSWLLNEIMGINFNEFINAYRLADFQSKAGTPEFAHFTILGLAYECGFNSKSVFNEFFKKSTGLTPSAWLRANN